MSSVHREGPHYVIFSNPIFTNNSLSTIIFNTPNLFTFFIFREKVLRPFTTIRKIIIFFITRSLDFGTAASMTRNSEACCEEHFQNHYISRDGSSSFK